MKRAALLVAALLVLAGAVEAEIGKYVRPGAVAWGQRIAGRAGIHGFGRSIAVIVAIGNYTNGWNVLASPRHDAERMEAFLRDEAGFDMIYTLVDEDVTYPALRTLMLQDLPREVGEQDRVLFYFSGHGTQQTLYGGKIEGYLPLPDSSLEGWGSMIAMADLTRWWAALSQARQSLFVLDACFSGLGVETKSDNLRRRSIDQLGRRGHHIFTAGTANQESYASLSRWGGSLFTTALIEGMRGRADSSSPEYPSDGIVTLGELKEYVRKRILSENLQGPMTPQLVSFEFDPEGEFFFIAKNSDGRLGTPAGSAGEPPPEKVAGVAKGSVMASAAIEPPDELRTTVETTAHRVRNVFTLAEKLQDCADCPELVGLPAGEFEMGSDFGPDAEKPQHRVRIAAEFAMGRTEVTLAEWGVCVAEGACSLKAGVREIDPVTGVSRDEAESYVAWLSGKTGETYRLPTEAEWEYAAGGGRRLRYPTGPVLLAGRAAFGSEQEGPSPVASYGANAFGLFDLAGNVWEWVADCAAPYTVHRTGIVTEIRPCDGVLRGGSWRSDEVQLRSTNRFFYPGDRAREDFGFRVARDVVP